MRRVGDLSHSYGGFHVNRRRQRRARRFLTVPYEYCNDLLRVSIHGWALRERVTWHKHKENPITAQICWEEGRGPWAHSLTLFSLSTSARMRDRDDALIGPCDISSEPPRGSDGCRTAAGCDIMRVDLTKGRWSWRWLLNEWGRLVDLWKKMRGVECTLIVE